MQKTRQLRTLFIGEYDEDEKEVSEVPSDGQAEYRCGATGDVFYCQAQLLAFDFGCVRCKSQSDQETASGFGGKRSSMRLYA
jgi:hypothetical protein